MSCRCDRRLDLYLWRLRAANDNGSYDLLVRFGLKIDERYQGLIFDCDGTLSHSMPLHYEAWCEAMGFYGIEFPESQFYSMAGMPSDKIAHVLSVEQAIPIDLVEAAERKEQAFERRLNGIEPLEKVCRVARAYHGKLPMAVASGGIRRVIDAQLQRIGMADFFSVVVTAEDTERHKPEPDVFLEAARRLGVEASRCLVFEDSPLGFEAARRAGMGWIDVRLDPSEW